MSTLPGYARRGGVLADVRVLRHSTVVVNRHSDGRRVTWPRDGTELLCFGSFNPASSNYMPGGRPWPEAVAAVAEHEQGHRSP